MKLITLSEKQLAANRANAQKSTGPRTPGGKYISSQNGLTHGLFAKAILFPGESVTNFNSLLSAYINEFLPTSQEETDLVETLAVCRWRIRRAWVFEASSVALEQRAQADTLAGEDPATQATKAVQSLTHPPRILDSLSRHESRQNRTYNQALDRLHRIRHEKNARPNPQLEENTEPPYEEPPMRTASEPSTNSDQSPTEPA